MALPPVGREQFLKQLGIIGATRSASAVNSAQANAKAPVDALQGLIDQKKSTQPQGLGMKVLSTALKPLIVLDTPRRAIISGIRETVDALDSDANTTASWGDFKNQTLNTTYGFGTAFPMKGWLGRTVGFIGDVAFDPLTYATFGSTVAKKAVVRGLVDAAGAPVTTRAALGGIKNVSGRQGRAALAELSRTRLKLMADDGVRTFRPGEIDGIVKNIYAKGKREMPGYLKDDIGIKGPGIYYFGSRIKVTGSGPVGDLLERGLTKTRLALVNPKYKANPGQYLHRAITPDGTFQINYLEPEAIKRYRVGLANGTLSDRQAVIGAAVLRMADNQRLITAKALENGTQKANTIVTDSAMDGYKTKLHTVLESGEELPASDPRFFVVEKIRQFFREVGKDIKEDGQNLDNTFVFDMRDDYLPHMESDNAILDRVRMGEELWDIKSSGRRITDTRKTASSFRGRRYGEDDIFFGHKLTGSETVDDMNRMARAPGDELSEETGRRFDAVDYDYYETDMTKIINKYVRHYSQQKGYFAFLRTGLKEGPDFLRLVADDIPIAAEFAARRAAALPAEIASIGPAIDDITGPLNARVNAQASVLAGGTEPYLAGDSLLLPSAPVVPVVATTSKDLLQETSTKFAQIGQQLKTFAENFDGTPPPVFRQILEQYEQLSDRLTTQIANNSAEELVDDIGRNIDFIEKFSQDLDKFGRDVKATMEINNSVFKRSVSSVRAPKWFDEPSSPTNVAMRDAVNGRVNKLTELETRVETVISRVAKRLGKNFQQEAGTVPQRYTPPVGGSTEAARIEAQEKFARAFARKLRTHSNLSRQLRNVRQKIKEAQGIGYVENTGLGQKIGKKDRVAYDVDDLIADSYEEVTQIYTPTLRTERTIKAGFAVEDFVIHSESLAEISEAIAAAKKLNHGYLPGDEFIATVVAEHKNRLWGRIDRLQDATQQILVALRQLRLTTVTSKAIDDIFGETDVVKNFFKDYPFEKIDFNGNLKKFDGTVEKFMQLHLGSALDDGILPTKLKAYAARLESLESPTFGLRAVTEDLYPVHKIKTTAELNTTISDSPAMVQHQDDYKVALAGKAATAKAAKVQATRAKELEGTSRELRKEFYDYLRGRKLQAANYRKRIREQILPKAKQAESELEAFRAQHLKSSSAWIDDVINPSQTKNVYKARKVTFREFLRLKSLEHFPNSVGFFEEFAESNRGVFNFVADIEEQAKTGVMSQWDYRIGLSILERTYVSKYGTGVFESKTFDNIFQQFFNSPTAPTVTYEQFLDIARHSLGVKFYDDIDDMILPTLFDLEARVVAQQEYALRLSAQAVRAEQNVINLTPNQFFQKQETGELGDLLPSQIKQIELEEDDFYPFAKAVEKRANALFALKNINGEMVDWTLGQQTQLTKGGQPFLVSEQQWSKLINTKDLSYVPNDEIDYILSWLRQPNVQQIVAGRTDIADEEMLQLFVNYIRSTQPMAAADDVRAQSRNSFIIKAWEKSQAKKTLDEISRLKKMTVDGLAKRQNSNPVRVIDGELTDLNATSVRRTTEGVAAQERNDAYGIQIDGDVDELMRLRTQLSEQLENELDPYTPDTRPMRNDESFRARQAKREAGIESAEVDPKKRDVVDVRKETEFTDAAKVFEEAEGPDLIKQDREYVKLLRMGVPREVLDGSLDGLNQWIRDNASATLGLIEKINIKAADMDVYLTGSLVDKTPKQLIQEIQILTALREKGLETPATKGKTGRMIRERNRQLELKFTPEDRAAAEAAVEADRAVRPSIDNLLSKIDGLDEYGKPIYNPEQLAMRKQVNAIDKPVLDPDEFEQIGANSVGEFGDADYGLAGRNIEEAMTGNPAYKNIIEPDADADLVDELGESYVPFEPGEQFPDSTARTPVGTLINEPNYIDNPMDVDGVFLEGYGGRWEESSAGKLKFIPNNDKFQYNPNVSYAEQFNRPSKVGLLGAEPIVLPNADSFVKELIAGGTVPKNLEEPVEFTTAQFGVNLDGVNVALAKARLELATQPNVGRVASDVPIVNTAALERVENARQILNKVESTGEATPLEEVLLDAGVREAELLATTARMTEEQINEALLDGISSYRRPVFIRLESGELREVPYVSSETLVMDELGKAWVKLSEKFGKIEATEDFKLLWDNAKYFQDPRFIKELTNYLGGFTKFHKAYATLTPGFHVRNLIGNSFQYILAGGRMQNLKPATEIHFKWLAAYKKGDSWKTFLTTLDPADREAATIARNAMLGSGGGIYGDVFHEVVRGNKIYDNRLTRFSRKYGQMSDNMSRFVLGFDAAKQGMTSDMATARVRKFYFDYEDLSKLDRTMKQFIPFWIWSSRNLPLQLENMWLNPKPYAIYNSFVRNIRDKESEKSKPLPPFLQEVQAYQLPGMSAYAAPDLNFTRVQQQLSQLVNPKKFGTNLNPLFRIPTEQIIGQNLYNDKEILTAEDRLVNILQGLVVPVATGDRLLNSYGDAKINAWLGVFGVPVRKRKGE